MQKNPTLAEWQWDVGAVNNTGISTAFGDGVYDSEVDRDGTLRAISDMLRDSKLSRLEKARRYLHWPDSPSRNRQAL
jgi:hypothetical protein